MTTLSSEPISRLEQVILYPRLKALSEDIRDCQQLSKLAGEPHCMALEGPTGAGKTTLVRLYAERFPREQHPDGARIPVFYMEMPSPATIKGTASKLLERLGDPAAHRGPQWSLDYRLQRLIPDLGVELIILDDFHHLIDSDSDRVLDKVSEWLKVLIKETGVPVLVVGSEGKVERVLRTNAQLSRLFAVRESLHPFRWDALDPHANVEFNTFMGIVEGLMAFPLTDALPRRELLYRLHYATDGIIANLMNLLRSAQFYCQRQHQSRISLALLAYTFDKRLGKHLHSKLNPFREAHGARFTPPAAAPA